MTLPAVAAPRGTLPRGAGAPARRRTTLTAYLFLAPFLVLFGAFVAWPLVFGLWVSLHRWNPLVDEHPFVGLENYADLFTPDSLSFEDFWRSMSATGIFTLFSVPLLLVIPLALALLLNRDLRGGAVFRAIIFAPYVLGVAVVGVMWKFLLDPQFGAVNGLLRAVGLDAVPWVVDLPWVWVSLIGVTVWWTLGFNTVILLAGLKGINRELYDAAAVDGAGPVRTFWSVTLPGLRAVLTFVTTLTVIAAANVYGQSVLITEGGPGNETRTAIMYIADQGLTQQRMGAATAMSYVLFAILAVISVVNFRVQRER